MSGPGREVQDHRGPTLAAPRRAGPDHPREGHPFQGDRAGLACMLDPLWSTRFAAETRQMTGISGTTCRRAAPGTG